MSLVTLAKPPQFPPIQGREILNREEAKSKLQKLTPGTEEYCQLQDALLRTAGIVEISLPTLHYRVDTSSKNCTLLGGFGSSEHVAIGDAVELEGLEKDTPLIKRGNTPVRFGQIIALAGDFYGVVDEPISLGDEAGR